MNASDAVGVKKETVFCCEGVPVSLQPMMQNLLDNPELLRSVFNPQVVQASVALSFCLNNFGGLEDAGRPWQCMQNLLPPNSSVCHCVGCRQRVVLV